MENTSPLVAAPHRSGLSDRTPPLPDHWRLARAAHVDLLLMGMPRVNLLLIAPDGVVRYVLESLLLDLRDPITRWSPGEALHLPDPERAGTLVLNHVHALPPADQLRVIEWMETAEGRTQVVSTTPAQLLPRVHAGEFIDILYYRLNTVCVDVTR